MPLMNNVAVPVDDDLEICRVALSRAMARYPEPPMRDALRGVLYAIVTANAVLDDAQRKRL